MHNVLIKLWREYRGFALFVILMIIFRSALADWNTVPTGSMKPTIVEGDRIFVNKLAYDLRVPLTHISIYKFGDPKRGDIVVFDLHRLRDIRDRIVRRHDAPDRAGTCGGEPIQLIRRGQGSARPLSGAGRQPGQQRRFESPRVRPSRGDRRGRKNSHTLDRL